MKIETIDEATIRVVLSGKEMNAYHLSYEGMNSSDAATKKLLISVLGRVRTQSDLNLENSRLYVEAYPFGEGGLLLYVNLMRAPGQNGRSGGVSVPLLFSFRNFDLLCAGCARLWKQTPHLILDSGLYRAEGRYILIVWSYGKLEQRLIRIGKEYASLAGKGVVALAWVKEHGKAVLERRAVEELAKLGE